MYAAGTETAAANNVSLFLCVLLTRKICIYVNQFSTNSIQPLILGPVFAKLADIFSVVSAYGIAFWIYALVLRQGSPWVLLPMFFEHQFRIQFRNSNSSSRSIHASETSSNSRGLLSSFQMTLDLSRTIDTFETCSNS